jgi:hypothetical protein
MRSVGACLVLQGEALAGHICCAVNIADPTNIDPWTDHQGLGGLSTDYLPEAVATHGGRRTPATIEPATGIGFSTAKPSPVMIGERHRQNQATALRCS